MKLTKINNMNKQKFVHYIMMTFTYSVGVGTTGLLIFSFLTALKII